MILPRISFSFSGWYCDCFWLETDVEEGASELIYTTEWAGTLNEWRSPFARKKDSRNKQNE